MAKPRDSRRAPEALTANMVLSLAGSRVAVSLTVPSAVVEIGDTLPAVRALTSAVVATAEAKEAAEGRAISCRKGCGACCRQIVPIAPVEARRLRALVEALPEPRRSAVRDRFAEASRRLDEAGIAEELRRPEGMTPEEVKSIGLAYFALGIACPFLEDESCSIHPDRPIVCREYLVTTPAENCNDPSPETIRRVPLAGSVARALGRVDSKAESVRYVALSLVVDGPESPVAPERRPGPLWIEAILKQLTGQSVPSNGPPSGPKIANPRG